MEFACPSQDCLYFSPRHDETIDKEVADISNGVVGKATIRMSHRHTLAAKWMGTAGNAHRGGGPAARC
jgi:hypothetical protein